MKYIGLIIFLFSIFTCIGCCGQSRNVEKINSYAVIFGSIDGGPGFNFKILEEPNKDGVIEVKKGVNLHYWLVNQTDSDVFLFASNKPVRISKYTQVIHDGDYESFSGGVRHTAVFGSSTIGEYTLMRGANAKGINIKGASDDQIISGEIDLFDIEKVANHDYFFEITVSVWLWGYKKNTGDQFKAESNINLKIKIID